MLRGKAPSGFVSASYEFSTASKNISISTLRTVVEALLPRDERLIVGFFRFGYLFRFSYLNFKNNTKPHRPAKIIDLISIFCLAMWLLSSRIILNEELGVFRKVNFDEKSSTCKVFKTWKVSILGQMKDFPGFENLASRVELFITLIFN